jgi:hypothetical protein
MAVSSHRTEGVVGGGRQDAAACEENNVHVLTSNPTMIYTFTAVEGASPDVKTSRKEMSSLELPWYPQRGEQPTMTRMSNAKHGDSLAVYLPSARGGLLVLVPTDPHRLKQNNGTCAAMELPTVKRTAAAAAADNNKGTGKWGRSFLTEDDDGLPVEWKLLSNLASEGLLVRYGAGTACLQVIHVESRACATVSLPTTIKIESVELMSGDTWLVRAKASSSSSASASAASSSDGHVPQQQFFLRWSGLRRGEWKDAFQRATRAKPGSSEREKAFAFTLHPISVNREDGGGRDPSNSTASSVGGGSGGGWELPTTFVASTDARGYLSPYSVPHHLSEDLSARVLAHPNSHLQVELPKYIYILSSATFNPIHVC